MPYATAADFLEQYQEDETVQISNQDDPDEILARDSFISQALIKAEGEALTYLGRYSHPFVNPETNTPIAPPSYLVYAICAIARKQMERYNHRDQVLRDYDDVIRWLRAISGGAPLMGDNGKPIQIADADQAADVGMTGANIGMGDAFYGANYAGSINAARSRFSDE